MHNRPVMAIFDVTIVKCDPDKRANTLKQSILFHGPTDSTVTVDIVSESENIDEEVLDDSVVDDILEKLSESGEVILVR